MTSTWSIVRFPIDNSVEAVPTSWLNGNRCVWPPYPPNSQKLIDAIEKLASPGCDWQEYPIIPFRNNVYDNFNVANKKAKKALTTSDLESDSQVVEQTTKRKIKLKKAFSFSSVEEESLDFNPPELHSNEFSSTKVNTHNNSEDEGHTHPSKSKVNTKKVNIIHNVEVFPNGLATNCNNDLVASSTDTQHSRNLLSSDIYDMLTRILRKQELLHVVVADIRQGLDNIEARLLKAPVECEKENSILAQFELPLNSTDNLAHFEEFFASNQNAFEKAVREVSLLGGRHLYDFVYRSGKMLISNSYASMYSYCGKRNKKAFKVLHLNKLLIQAGIRFNPKVTEKDVEIEISKWLRRAAERAKNEKQ